MIVTLSSLSFLTSTILFSLLTSWWSSFRWFCCGQDAFRRVWNVDWNRGVARGACCWCLCGRICRSRSLCSCIEAGYLLSREDSDGEHLCSEEVSGGFLRPSLEETLAYNRSISFGEEEKGGVVGSSRIRFLMFSFCLPFVFLLFYTLICFCFSFVARARNSCLDSSFCEWDVTSGPAQGMEAVKTAVWLGLGICIPPWIEGSSGLLDLPWFGNALFRKSLQLRRLFI